MIMEELLKETAKQVPALVVLVLLSIVFGKAAGLVISSFLKQLSETRSDYLNQSNAARNDYLQAIDHFRTEILTERNVARDIIKENTVALNALSIEVRELRPVLLPVIQKLRER